MKRKSHSQKFSRPRPDMSDAAMRKCLNCDREFPSDWRGNRICKKCKTYRGWGEGVGDVTAGNHTLPQGRLRGMVQI